MGSAFERLLARPSALLLLRRTLLEELEWKSVNRTRRHTAGRGALYEHIPKCHYRHRSCIRVPTAHIAALSTSNKPEERHPHARSSAEHDETSPTVDDVISGSITFECLKYEASVEVPSASQSRLVDQKEHAQNMQLWAALLHVRKRLDGAHGCKDIWYGMRKRGVDLSVEGGAAESLWASFIDATNGNSRWLSDVLGYAASLKKRSGHCWAGLYEQVIGMFIKSQPAFAQQWHHYIENLGLIPANASSSIIGSTAASHDFSQALKAFVEVYISCKEKHLYDQCISAALAARPFHDVYAWHQFLVSQGDMPTSSFRSESSVAKLFWISKRMEKKASSREPQMHDVQSAGTSPPKLFTRANMNTVVGEVHGIQQKTIGDAFCARICATRAFSTPFVLSTLKILGVECVGPLTLQEMAVRTKSTTEFVDILYALSEANISIVGGIFSIALERFAMDGKKDMFDFVVSNDRHPDTYDDWSLQRKLLRSSLQMGRVLEARVLLNVLGMFDRQPEASSWNLLLQHQCQEQDRDALLQIITDMQSRNVNLNNRSLASIRECFLRPRRAGKQPVKTASWRHDDLAFVTHVYLHIVRGGQCFHGLHWREVVKRQGMTHRMLALDSLTQTLFQFYNNHDNMNMPAVELQRSLGAHATKPMPAWTVPRYNTAWRALHLGELFRPALQRAIVAWGFKSAVNTPGGDKILAQTVKSHSWLPDIGTPQGVQHVQPFARGLALLRSLGELGLELDIASIRKEVMQRLRMLYGPQKSTFKYNNAGRRINFMSLSKRVRHIQEVWGPPGKGILKIRPSLLRTSADSEVALYYELCGSRHARRLPEEVANGDAPADANDGSAIRLRRVPEKRQSRASAPRAYQEVDEYSGFAVKYPEQASHSA